MCNAKTHLKDDLCTLNRVIKVKLIRLKKAKKQVIKDLFEISTFFGMKLV